MIPTRALLGVRKLALPADESDGDMKPTLSGGACASNHDRRGTAPVMMIARRIDSPLPTSGGRKIGRVPAPRPLSRPDQKVIRQFGTVQLSAEPGSKPPNPATCPVTF